MWCVEGEAGDVKHAWTTWIDNQVKSELIFFPAPVETMCTLQHTLQAQRERKSARLSSRKRGCEGKVEEYEPGCPVRDCRSKSNFL